MAKKLYVGNYTFDASARGIILRGHVVPEELLIITNVTDNIIIYNFADTTKGYNSHQFAYDDYEEPITIITLVYDTTSMSDTDKLQIFVQGASTEFTPAEDLLDPVGKLRVSNPGNLIDTDFEYGLQSTKWESLQTVSNVPTIYASNGDVPIEGISDATVSIGNKTVTVTGTVAHGVSIGDPIAVSGMDLYAANGYFIVTAVADDFTFSYEMDVTAPGTTSIYGSYTTIVPSKFFEGSSLNIDIAEGVITDEGSPSNLTVTTEETHGFQNGTKVYLRNTAGPRTFIVANSAATAPDGRPYIDTVESFSTLTTFDVGTSTGRGGALDKQVYMYDWESTYTRYIGPTDINTSNGQITWNNHGLKTNYTLLFNTPIRGGTDIGLTDGTVYYVQVVDSNTITLSNSFDSAGGGGVPILPISAHQGTYGYPRLGLVYKVEGASGVRRDTVYAAAGAGGGTGSIGLTSSSSMTVSGDGSSGNPFTATSTNKIRNSTGSALFTIAGGSGTIDWQITSSSENNFDFARIFYNGSQLSAVSGNGSSDSGQITNVQAGDTVEFRYTKDGSVDRFNDEGVLNSLVFTPDPPVAGLTDQLSGSDLADNEFGLGTEAPTGLIAFQGRTPTSTYTNSNDTVSFLPNQQENGRYGTQGIMYPSLSVTSGNLAGSFNVSTTNSIASYGTGSEIYYAFVRPLASLRNTIYSPAHGLVDNQIVTVTVNATDYANGERFAFADANGPITINNNTFQATISIISNDVFRMRINTSPNTNDMTSIPSTFTIDYDRVNPTFNTLYLGNHRIPESVDAEYTTGAGGVAPAGFVDGDTYTLTKVNDDRVSFAAGGSSTTAFGPANTAIIGNTSNGVSNWFIDVEGDLSVSPPPTTLNITNVYFRGDFSSATEYVDITFDDATSFRIGATDDSGDTSVWTRSTTFAPKNMTSLLVSPSGSVGFNVSVDPSVQVNFSPSGMSNWWELIFEVDGTSTIVFTSPGSGEQIFDVDSTVGAYDGVYEIAQVPTPNTFELNGDFKIPALSFDFTATEVNETTDTINFGKNHNLITGEKIVFSTTGTTILPAGVTDIFAIVTGRQTISLASSYADAIIANAMQLTASAGTHTISTDNVIKGVIGLGSITTESGSKNVSGVNTRFLANFKRFDQIWIDNGTYAQAFLVNDVTSNTTMTLFEAPTFTISNTDYYYSTQLVLRPDGYNLHLPFDGGVDITAGTSPYSKIVRQSRKYFRYQSGKGIQNSFAINFNPPKVVKELIRASGTTATVKTEEAHNLQVGDQIKIAGALVDFGQNTYNGIFPVDTVVDPFTYTYEMSSTPLDTRAGGFPTYVRTGWTDSYVRAGMFDDQNGFFMEYDGQKLYMVRRSSTLQISGSVTVQRGSQVVTGTGTSFTSQLVVGDRIVIRGQTYQVVEVSADNRMVVQPGYRGVNSTLVKCTKTVDVKVPQEDWNIDPADGTGPTKFNLDTTKIQMAYADYSWYGAGKIRYGFKDLNGHIRYLHEFTHNNRLDESYFRSGNLPARYEIENGPTPSTAPTLFHFGTSIIMDGRFDDDKAYQFTSQSRQMAITDSNINSYTTNANSSFAQVTLNGVRVYVYKIQLATTDATNLSIGMKALDTSGNIPEDTYVTQIKDVGGGNSEVYLGYPATQTDPTGSPTYPIVTSGTSLQFGDRAELDNYIPLTSVRLAPSVDSGITGAVGEREIINRMQLALKNAAVTANADSEVYLILNALPSRLRYQNAQRPSLSEIIEHQIEDTLLNTTVIYSAKVSGGSSIDIELGDLLEVGNSILGGDGVFPSGPDLLTLAVQPQVTSGFNFATPYRVSGKISWAESQA